MKTVFATFLQIVLVTNSFAQHKSATNDSVPSNPKAEATSLKTHQFIISKISGSNVRTEKERSHFIYKFNGEALNQDQVDSLTRDWEIIKIIIDETTNPIEHRISRGTRSEVEKNSDSLFHQRELYINSWMGHELPYFQIKDIEGNAYTTQTLRGKVIVLNFWFTACQPCLREMPQLNELRREFQSKNVVFLALSFDQEAQVRKFLSSHPFSYSVVAADSLVMKELGVQTWPTHIIVDKQGIIRYVSVGYENGSVDKLRKSIETILSK